MQDDFRPQRSDKGYQQRQYHSPAPQQMPQPESYESYKEDESSGSGVKAAVVLFVFMFLGLLAGGGYWVYSSMNKDKLAKNNSETMGEQTETPSGLQLDPGNNYGNKYAEGNLPLGDNKYVTGAAKKGHVLLCKPEFAKLDKTQLLPTGPWIIGRGLWSSKKKPAVSGNQSWQSSVNTTMVDGKRNMQTNALPNHATGTFPVNIMDPTSMFDRNPYPIKGVELSIGLDGEPEYSETPACMGNEAGVMINGVVLLNGLDRYGRDAEAWEVHDACGGHPNQAGIYHYHKLPLCFKNAGVDTVVGYALDGYPITGAVVGKNNILTTDDLDECHGIVSDINLDGKRVNMYHYVLTQDFPYSVSCYRNAGAFSGGLAPDSGGGGVGGQSLNVQGGGQVQL